MHLKPSTRERVIQRHVEMTIEDELLLTSETSMYILEHIISGLASSTGSVRSNLASSLSRVVEVHFFASGSEALDLVVDAIVRVYGDRNGGTLDEALGMLAAISVLPRCVRQRDISASSCRNNVRLLRGGAGSIRSRSWNLLPLVLSILKHFLNELVMLGKIGFVASELLSWTEEQTRTYAGLTVALLLLLEYKFFFHRRRFRVCILVLPKFIMSSWSR